MNVLLWLAITGGILALAVIAVTRRDRRKPVPPPPELPPFGPQVGDYMVNDLTGERYQITGHHPTYGFPISNKLPSDRTPES